MRFRLLRMQCLICSASGLHEYVIHTSFKFSQHNVNTELLTCCWSCWRGGHLHAALLHLLLQYTNQHTQPKSARRLYDYTSFVSSTECYCCSYSTPLIEYSTGACRFDCNTDFDWSVDYSGSSVRFHPAGDLAFRCRTEPKICGSHYEVIDLSLQMDDVPALPA